jgi:hypothetical protein
VASGKASALFPVEDSRHRGGGNASLFSNVAKGDGQFLALLDKRLTKAVKRFTIDSNGRGDSVKQFG